MRALLAHAPIREKLWFSITNVTDELSSVSVFINLIYIRILRSLIDAVSQSGL